MLPFSRARWRIFGGSIPSEGFPCAFRQAWRLVVRGAYAHTVAHKAGRPSRNDPDSHTRDISTSAAHSRPENRER